MHNEDDFDSLMEEKIPEVKWQASSEKVKLRKQYLSYLKELRQYLIDNEISLKKLPTFDQYQKLLKDDKLFDFPD